jgi:hypothetical protein
MGYTAEQLFFQWLLRIYVWLLCKAYGLDRLKTGEIKMNYIVKDDNPDVLLTVELGDVLDGEGKVIPNAAINVEAGSTDENVVSATPITDDATKRSWNIHFGAPGQASVNVQASSVADGLLLSTGSDGFTVTTGDPKSISSIKTTFAGLTPVDETPAPVEEPPVETPPIETVTTPADEPVV